MHDKKSEREKKHEERELLKQEQITENTFNDRNRIPDEQNAWKETQFNRGRN